MMNTLGQLIITGISGTALTAEEKKFIQEHNIGGVILFSNNFESPAQLAELINSIQQLRDEYPLYICVDHEGGRVIRFKNHFTQFPSMLDIARLDSPKLCFNVSKIMAEELMACGVNLNLSPCCDVLVNPNNKVIGDRAFGNDGEMVAKFVSSAIRGFQTSGIMACAKHFPGHGATTKDSHLELPIVKRSLDELKNSELIPFIKAVKSRVEFVMLGHLIVDCIDPKLPCTISSKVCDFLRSELRFTKLILSDDMQMKAIMDNYGVEEAAEKAICAGVNILEYKDVEVAMQALEGLNKAKQSKELKSDVIKERTERVLESKKKNFKDYKPIYIPEIRKKVNSRPSQILLEEINKKLSELNNQE